MNELIVIVEEDPEGGYVAKALGVSLHTDADSLEELRERLRDAVHCHFDKKDLPKMIRLHFVREQVIAV